MLNLKLGLSALLLEVGAWSSQALLRGHSDAALATYLTTHAGASVLLSLAVLPLMASARARPRWAAIALTATFSFAVPVAGFIGILLAVVVLRTYQTPARPEDFGSLQLPEFDLHQRMQGSFRQAGLRAIALHALGHGIAQALALQGRIGRQRQLEPLRDAVALHQHHLRLKGIV